MHPAFYCACLALLPIACLREYDEDFAKEFAMQLDYVTEADVMPDDAEENVQLVLDRFWAHGWKIQIKVLGGQPRQPKDLGDEVTSVDPIFGGPDKLWLAWDWFEKTPTARARELWHENVHKGQIVGLGGNIFSRLVSRDDYWTVALEIPCEVQSLIVFDHLGYSEPDLYRFVNHLVDVVYANELGVSEDWQRLARDIFYTRIDLIMDERENF